MKTLTNLTDILERSEAIYWGKLYEGCPGLKTAKMQIRGATALALPEIDLLAMNRVIGWGGTGKETAEDIMRMVAFYSQHECRRFFVQLSPLAPRINRLRQLLQEHGFMYYNSWSKLWKPTASYNPSVSSFLKCKPIGLDQGATYGKIILESFNWSDQRLIPFLASAIGKPGYQHYLIYLEEKPIAAGAFHWYDQYGSMAFAATLPEYRGLGAQSLLIHARIKAAQRLGIHYLFSETAVHRPEKPSQSFQNLQKFGFDLAYERENWVFTHNL